MAAKTKTGPENLSLFENDQEPDSPAQVTTEETEQITTEEKVSKELLLSARDPEARELLDLGTQVMELKPWRWMEEVDLIGIEHPETGEIGFISVMGSLGEHQAVALYLGAEGFYDFIDLQNNEFGLAEHVLEVRHLQAAFSERKYLEKEDRDLIKQLGLKFRGEWPMFRSYRPGYLPWFITPEEARFLIHALSQIIEIAKRVRDEEEPFQPTGRVEKGGYLMRVARKDGSALVWEDQVWRIPRSPREPVKATVDDITWGRLKGLPQSKLELELDLFFAPASFGKRGQRPMAVYVLMLADSDSGFILGTELMTAEGSLPAMHGRIPNALAKTLLQNKILPQKLLVRSELLHTLLRSFAQALNIELRLQEELPAIDEAAEHMGQFMRRGKP